MMLRSPVHSMGHVLVARVRVVGAMVPNCPEQPGVDEKGEEAEASQGCSKTTFRLHFERIERAAH